jgi:hypothetical protein
MDFIRRYHKGPEVRHRPGGPALLTSAAAVLLCLTGLAGCGNSANGQESSGSSVSPSATCSALSSVRRDPPSPAARLPVLAAAQVGSLDIPAPDVNIDEQGYPPASDDTADEIQTLAGDGQGELDAPDHAPFRDTEAETQAKIDQEATGVGLTEDVTLLTDESESGEDASDFGQAICNAVGSVLDDFSRFGNVNKVYSYLAQQGSQPAIYLEDAIENAVKQFVNVFGPCFYDSLGVAKTIASDINKVFCG